MTFYDYFNVGDHEMDRHWAFTNYPKTSGGNYKALKLIYPNEKLHENMVDAKFRISLSDGEVAMNDAFLKGIPVMVTIYQCEMPGFKRILNITIPQGQNYVDVSTKIPGDLKKMRVSYQLLTGLEMRQALSNASYLLYSNVLKSENDTTPNDDYWESSDFENKTFDISLKKGVKIRGKVLLSSGKSVMKDYSYLYLNAQKENSTIYPSPYFLFKKGERELDFLLVVEPNERYQLSCNTSLEGFVSSSYLYRGLLSPTFIGNTYEIEVNDQELMLPAFTLLAQ